MRSLTFEGTDPNKLHDITVSIPNGTLILAAARFDFTTATPPVYANSVKTVAIELGTVIGNSYVVDNDPQACYFKVIVDSRNIVDFADSKYITSITYPNTGFKMQGDLHRQCQLTLRNGQTGAVLGSDLKYYCLHFNLIGPN